LAPCRIINKPREASLQKQQLDIGGWPYLDSMEDLDFASDPLTMCLELFSAEPVAAELGLRAQPGRSMALLLMSQTRSATYAELAAQNTRRHLPHDELRELEKVPWYTRVGIVVLLASDVFEGQLESDLIIL
jgi:hypothetical protein